MWIGVYDLWEITIEQEIEEQPTQDGSEATGR